MVKIIFIDQFYNVHPSVLLTLQGIRNTVKKNTHTLFFY